MTELSEEIRQANQKLEELREANKKGITSLARFGAAVDPGSVLQIRMESFIEFMFSRMGGLSPEQRELFIVQFEMSFEEKVHEALKQIQSEVRKAQLSAGMPSPPPMPPNGKRSAGGLHLP